MRINAKQAISHRILHTTRNTGLKDVKTLLPLKFDTPDER